MSDDVDAAFLLGETEPEKPEGYEAARRAVVSCQRASTSFVQRKLGVGYNRAAQLMAALEENGVVSAADHVGRREIFETELPEEDGDEDGDEGEDRKPTGKKPRKSGNVEVVQALLQPVSISFLADVLGRDKGTVRKRLAGLPAMGYHRGNTPLYDFRQALEYLVTPRFNAAEAIKRLGTDDLPTSLQKDVWDAKLKKQQWEEKAKDLWRTEDVMAVLGEAFLRLRTTTQLWSDQLGENHALPAEVRADLTKMVDGLQSDLHKTLVEMPQQRATKSQIGEIEGTELDG